jgi:prepilin-type N-terminal cleavage/methylation domain-containing protein
MENTGKKQNAFTLIELLVCITIIVLLLVMLLPALRQAREFARRSHCGSNLHQIYLACSIYEHDYAGALPPFHLPPVHYRWPNQSYLAYNKKPVGVSPWNFAFLYEKNELKNIDLLQNEYVIIKNNNKYLKRYRYNSLNKLIEFDNITINNQYINKLKPRNFRQQCCFDLLQNDNINFQYSNTFMEVINILGYYFLIIHGDGMNKQTIENAFYKYSYMYAARGIQLYGLLCGHFHVPEIKDVITTAGSIIINGNIVGSNYLSVQKLQSDNKPSQTYIVVEEGKGITYTRKVVLD